MKVVKPTTLLINKDYSVLLTDETKQNRFLSALHNLFDTLKAGNLDTTATIHDDLAVWFRNLFFMEDKRFETALAPYRDDATLHARAWRIHNLCWALSQAAHIRGEVVDIGCYEAKSTHVFCTYNEDLINHKILCLFDWFDAPDGDYKKALHGPNLQRVVEERMANFHPWINHGNVFDTIPNQLPDEICFAHIDLNDAKAEAHVMPEVYYRMPRGGIIVFDDYGFARYRESALAHQRFLADKPERILELPTGQGLMVKLYD